MLWAIIAAEVAFWVVIVLGLVVRYVLRLPTFGAILLALTPIIDLALLVLLVIDLRDGATAHWSHGLGAIYLGFSIVYGPRMVRWADARFIAFRDKKPVARKPSLYGSDKVKREWRETLVWWLACSISIAILGGCIAIAGGFDRAGELVAWAGRLLIVAGAATVIPLSYMIWPKRAPAEPDPA